MDNADIERHISEVNAWRVAFGHDMDDIRRILGESKDIDRETAEGIASVREKQRDMLAVMRAEQEISNEDWRKLAQHDAAIRIIFNRYLRRRKRRRP
jgi:hypothetical protein